MTYASLLSQFQIIMEQLDSLPPLPGDPKRLHINNVASMFESQLRSGVRQERLNKEIQDDVRERKQDRE